MDLTSPQAQTAMRQTRIEITIQKPGYDVLDISDDVAEDLLTFEVETNMSDKANDFTLTMQDKTGKWLGPYMPPQGARVTIKLYATSWDFTGQQFADCGVFYIHSVRYKIAGRRITIKGKSTPVSGKLQYQKNSQAWEGSGGNLQTIAQQISSANGFQCQYLAAENPTYDRSEQRWKTDLGHLRELCDDQGISMAIHNDTIVLFDEESYEANPSKGTITTTDLIDGDLEWQTNDLCGSSRATYHDPDSGTVGTATFTPSNPPATDTQHKSNDRLDYQRALEEGVSQNPIA
jgi:uncharacterized protein